VTIENYSLARWSLVIELLPVVSMYLSDDNASQVATQVVRWTLQRNSKLTRLALVFIQITEDIIKYSTIIYCYQ